MSLPFVLDDLGSEASEPSESRQKEEQGELGVTCNATVREGSVARSKQVADRTAIILIIGCD